MFGISSESVGASKLSAKRRFIAKSTVLAMLATGIPVVAAPSIGAEVPGAAPPIPTEPCSWNWNFWDTTETTSPTEDDLVDPRRSGTFELADNDLGTGSWWESTVTPTSTEIGVADGVGATETTDDQQEIWYGIGFFELEGGASTTFSITDNQYWEGHSWAMFDSAGTQIGRYPDLVDGLYYGSTGTDADVSVFGGINKPTSTWSETFTLTAPADGIVYLHYLLVDDGARARTAVTDLCRSIIEDDESLGNVPGTTVTIDVIANDPSADPTTVEIVGADSSGNLVVPGEGTWSVDPVTGAISFVPEAGFEGDPTPITYTAEVDGNVSDPATVTVGYVPVIEDDSDLGNLPGTAVTVDVTGNDTNVDPTTVMITDPSTGLPVTSLVVPGEGTWDVDPVTGEITFTPEAGFEGDPTPIDYIAADIEGNVAEPATVTVGYVPVVEDDESLGNTIGDAVTIDVTGNDTNVDPTTVMITDPATGLPVTSLVVPGEGTWDVDPVTGEITFTPEAGFEGDPTPITYTAEDIEGNVSPPATVTVDYVPTAVDDESLGNPVGSTVTVDVLANDGDLDPTSVMITDPATGLPVASLVVPGEGTWTVDPVTGAISFVPELGFEGDPTPIDYTASDDDGNEVTAEVTVTYAPVLEDDESLGNPAGSQVAVPLLGNDSDDIDPATIAFIDPATGLALNPGQNLVVPGEGTWMVNQATGVAFFTPEAGFEGDPTPVDYQAADTAGVLGEPATITVDYIPTAVDDESLGNTPGSTVVVDVLANDGDIDPTSVMITDPATGLPVTSLVVPGEGTWDVDPVTGEITFTPEAGFEGNPTPIDYTAADDEGNEVTAEVVVGYTPLAAPDESLGNAIGDAVTIDVLSNDPSSNLDPTTVMITDPDTGLPVTSLVVPGEGTWDVDPVTGEITFTPEAGFEGDPTPITYTVMDDLGQATAPVEVIVDYVPGAVDDESLGNTPGSTVVVDVLANDGDIDPTTVMITDPATGLPVTSLVVPGEGTWDVDPVTGEITFTPEAGFEGNPTPIDYTAMDNDGNEVTAEVVVGYTPEGAPDESLDNVPGTAVTIDVLSNDPALNLDPTTVTILDPDTGLPVTSLVVPGEGTWDVDPVTGEITFTPEPGFEGNPTPITYTVADDLGQAIPPVEVIVDYLPVPPAAPDESLGNVAGSTVTIDVLTNDGDIDPTTVMILDALGNPVTSLTVPGEGVWSVDPVTGAISFTPEAGFTGNPTPIEYVASDVLGVAISPQAVTITYLDEVVPTLAFTGVESYQLFLAALLAIAAGMGFSTIGRRSTVARKEN